MKNLNVVLEDGTYERLARIKVVMEFKNMAEATEYAVNAAYSRIQKEEAERVRNG